MLDVLTLGVKGFEEYVPFLQEMRIGTLQNAKPRLKSMMQLLKLQENVDIRLMRNGKLWEQIKLNLLPGRNLLKTFLGQVMENPLQSQVWNILSCPASLLVSLYTFFQYSSSYVTSKDRAETFSLNALLGDHFPFRLNFEARLESWYTNINTGNSIILSFHRQIYTQIRVSLYRERRMFREQDKRSSPKTNL